MSGSYYSQVSGELSWSKGDVATKSFSIPVNVAALARDNVTSGEIDIALTNGTGAQLAGAETGRVLIAAQTAGIGMSIPACGTAVGLPCAAAAPPGIPSGVGSSSVPTTVPSSTSGGNGGQTCDPADRASLSVGDGTGTASCQ